MTELPETRFTRVDGLDIADRRLHQLKGVPDEWQLYAVEHT